MHLADAHIHLKPRVCPVVKKLSPAAHKHALIGQTHAHKGFIFFGDHTGPPRFVPLLAEKQPLEVVDEALIPALDIVGAKYEKGTLFLPQLLQAASAAQSAFEEIKTAIAQKGEGSASKGRIVIATVKGDVHDIGKNIVRVILENYGFEVIDLGRDVPVETVVNTVREKDVHLVGLSALMTTTLKSMEETIRALHDAKLDCKIMVGGAVLTPEYAKKIGADWYAKDAKQSADIAKEFFGV